MQLFHWKLFRCHALFSRSKLRFFSQVLCLFLDCALPGLCIAQRFIPVVSLDCSTKKAVTSLASRNWIRWMNLTQRSRAISSVSRPNSELIHETSVHHKVPCRLQTFLVQTMKVDCLVFIVDSKAFLLWCSSAERTWTEQINFEVGGSRGAVGWSQSWTANMKNAGLSRCCFFVPRQQGVFSGLFRRKLLCVRVRWQPDGNCKQ